MNGAFMDSSTNTDLIRGKQVVQNNPSSNQLEEIRLRDAQAADYRDFIKSHRGEYWIRAQAGLVLRALQPQKGHRVYDAGAGVGIYTLELARRFPEVSIFATDFSPASISLLDSQARQHGFRNIETEIADISNFKSDKRRFERAMCLDTIQHIPSSAARLRTIRNIYQMLTADGIFALVTYRWKGWIKPPQPKEDKNYNGTGLFRMAFTKDEIANLLREAGFRNVRAFGIIRMPNKIRKYLPAAFGYPAEYILNQLGFAEGNAQYLMAVGVK